MAANILAQKNSGLVIFFLPLTVCWLLCTANAKQTHVIYREWRQHKLGGSLAECATTKKKSKFDLARLTPGNCQHRNGC